ncbi:MAG: hypothetical protein PHH09_10600 [Methanoregulaceae archaeon]|jgi:hypothetical protein|nr:hypothetical protein [Methanoregulaceae archaeon]
MTRRKKKYSKVTKYSMTDDGGIKKIGDSSWKPKTLYGQSKYKSKTRKTKEWDYFF